MIVTIINIILLFILLGNWKLLHTEILAGLFDSSIVGVVMQFILFWMLWMISDDEFDVFEDFRVYGLGFILSVLLTASSDCSILATDVETGSTITRIHNAHK